MLYPGGGWAVGPAQYVSYNLTHPLVWGLAGIIAVPIGAGTVYAWRAVELRWKVLLLLGVPYVGVHFVMAQCDEPRYWMTLLVLSGPFLAASWDKLHASEKARCPE
jgi:hypothetical protein